MLDQHRPEERPDSQGSALSEAMTDKPNIEGFVRETLGCTCPPEVFTTIRDIPADNEGEPRRLLIGERLLIYILDSSEAVEPGCIETWVRKGRAERDSRAMNRFRLVIVADDPVASGPLCEAAFQQTPGVDDRVHLHVVARSAVAAL
jgi:hypothetical protein